MCIHYPCDFFMWWLLIFSVDTFQSFLLFGLNKKHVFATSFSPLLLIWSFNRFSFFICVLAKVMWVGKIVHHIYISSISTLLECLIIPLERNVNYKWWRFLFAFQNILMAKVLNKTIFLIVQEPSLSSPLIHFHNAYVAEVSDICSIYLVQNCVQIFMVYLLQNCVIYVSTS